MQSATVTVVITRVILTLNCLISSCKCSSLICLLCFLTLSLSCCTICAVSCCCAFSSTSEDCCCSFSSTSEDYCCSFSSTSEDWKYQPPTNIIASPKHNTDSNTVTLIPLLVAVIVHMLYRMTEYCNKIKNII